ncbi:hypothetical protein DFH06DRAFT_1296825 [Mycena polygramma]|nr:hypothetical protein DFH06DRAFT_1296825 [Mycena polygramma]
MSSASSGSNGEQHHQPIPVLAPADVQHAISLIQAAYAPSTATDLQQLQSLQSATTLRLAMQPTPAVWQGVYDGFLLSRWTSVARHIDLGGAHCKYVSHNFKSQSHRAAPPSSAPLPQTQTRYPLLYHASLAGCPIVSGASDAVLATTPLRNRPLQARPRFCRLLPISSHAPFHPRIDRYRLSAPFTRRFRPSLSVRLAGFPDPTFRAPSSPLTPTLPEDFPPPALEPSPTLGECALARAAAPSPTLWLPGPTHLYALVRERLPPSRATTRRVAYRNSGASGEKVLCLSMYAPEYTSATVTPRCRQKAGPE